MLLTLFTPEDILTYPWAKAWTEGILKNTFPKFLEVPRLSQIPQIVPFYHATMFVVFCLGAIWIVWATAYNHRERRQHSPEAYLIEQAKSRMRSITMFVGCTWLVVGLLHGFHSAGYGVNENDISIGKYAGLLFFSRPSLFIGAILLPWSSLLLFLMGSIEFVVEFAYFYPHLPWFSKNKSKK